MKLFDILKMALHNLWQRRLRTALNLIGVVIGCIVLLMTIAGASGVRDAFTALFDSSELARQILIYPTWQNQQEPPASVLAFSANMSDERRERIREQLISEWRTQNQTAGQQLITSDHLHTLKDLDHVQAIVPHVHMECQIRLDGDSTETAVEAGVAGAGPPSDSINRSVIVGSPLSDVDTTGAMLHEFLCFKLGYRDDADLQKLIGRTVHVEWKIRGRMSSLASVMSHQVDQLRSEHLERQLEFAAALQQLFSDLDKTSLSDQQKALLRDAVTGKQTNEQNGQDFSVHKSFVVRGIHRSDNSQSFAGLFYQRLFGEQQMMQIQRDVATEMKFADPNVAGLHNAVLIVDSVRNLKAVSQDVEALNLQSSSFQYVIDNIYESIDRSSWVVLAIAIAVLLTAAIGISNTLIISVLERTPEFGILKLLGARDRDLVLLMVLEGAMLGLMGAVAALLLSGLLSFGVRILVKMYIEYRLNEPIAGSLIQFSLPSILLMTAVSITVCVAASILPAIRAARLAPVVAMQRT